MGNQTLNTAGQHTSGRSSFYPGLSRHEGLSKYPTFHLSYLLVPSTPALISELSTDRLTKQSSLLALRIPRVTGGPSLGLLSIKDNGFYVHREVTLTLRLAQNKQTGIVKIKILPTPWLMTRNSCDESLASLLENTSRSRRVRKPVDDWQVRETLLDKKPPSSSITPQQVHEPVPPGVRKKFF